MNAMIIYFVFSVDSVGQVHNIELDSFGHSIET